MCGRFAVGRPIDDLAAEFDAQDRTDSPFGDDFNVAPGKPVVAVVSRPPVRESLQRRRELRLLRWGLVPSWADQAAFGTRVFNARAESAAEKPAFRDALVARRCLIPASGWYEWRGRTPYYVRPDDGRILAFGGLYEFNAGLVSCAIVTTAAVGELADIHHRMPLVLPRASWAAWLDPAAPPAPLLDPPADELVAGLHARAVGEQVGNVANNGRSLTEPAPPPATLF